jgi:hypothetical protein
MRDNEIVKEGIYNNFNRFEYTENREYRMKLLLRREIEAVPGHTFSIAHRFHDEPCNKINEIRGCTYFFITV